MRMHSVIFERDGEPIFGFHTCAVDKADAEAQAEAFFRGHPEHDPRIQYPDLVVRVEISAMPSLPPSDSVAPAAMEQPSRSEPTVIAVDKDGVITFNGEPISITELLQRLRATDQKEGKE